MCSPWVRRLQGERRAARGCDACGAGDAQLLGATPAERETRSLRVRRLRSERRAVPCAMLAGLESPWMMQFAGRHTCTAMIRCSNTSPLIPSHSRGNCNPRKEISGSKDQEC